MSDMLEYQRQLSTANEAETEQEVAGDESVAVSPQAASAMLAGPMAGVQRRALVQNMGQTLGNKGVQRMLSEVRRAASGTYGRSAASGLEGGSLEDDLADAVQSERSKGQPLPDDVRSSVERSLGHDMSKAVHTVNPDLNAAMGAKAFTSGNLMVFRSASDLHNPSIVKHESTHAIQQGFSTNKPTSIGAADTAHEKEAESNETVASAGGVHGHDDETVAMMRDEAVQRHGDDEEVAMMRDNSVQRDAEEDELQMMRDNSVQREAEGPEGEEEEIAMMRDTSVQREAEGPEGEEEEIAMMRDGAVQREAEGPEGEEEEIAMMRDNAVQREAETEEELA
jgi:hypothetical protein